MKNKKFSEADIDGLEEAKDAAIKLYPDETFSYLSYALREAFMNGVKWKNRKNNTSKRKRNEKNN